MSCTDAVRTPKVRPAGSLLIAVWCTSSSFSACMTLPPSRRARRRRRPPVVRGALCRHLAARRGTHIPRVARRVAADVGLRRSALFRLCADSSRTNPKTLAALLLWNALTRRRCFHRQRFLRRRNLCAERGHYSARTHCGHPQGRRYSALCARSGRGQNARGVSPPGLPRGEEAAATPAYACEAAVGIVAARLLGGTAYLPGDSVSVRGVRYF